MSKAASTPDLLYFQLGGFGDRQDLELGENGEITITSGNAGISWFYPGEKKSTKHETPDAGKWAGFMACLEELEVWSWESQYFHTDMCDGIQWEVKLELGDKTLHSHGTNKTPEGFDEFKAAIKELLS